MKKIFLYSLIVFILLICCIIIWYPRILTGYAGFFTIHNATKGAEAILVLSGNIETRLPCAIKLHKDGYASQILFTETKAPHPLINAIGCDEKTMAEAIAEQMKVNVPITLVPSLKGGATSTFDEAYDMREYCLQHSFRHIIIVTDNHHTRRALYAFKKVFQETTVLVESMGTPNSVFNEQNWWQSDRGISAYSLELIKYAVYVLSNQNVSFIENH